MFARVISSHLLLFYVLGTNSTQSYDVSTHFSTPRHLLIYNTRSMCNVLFTDDIFGKWLQAFIPFFFYVMHVQCGHLYVLWRISIRTRTHCLLRCNLHYVNSQADVKI